MVQIKPVLVLFYQATFLCMNCIKGILVSRAEERVMLSRKHLLFSTIIVRCSSWLDQSKENNDIKADCIINNLITLCYSTLLLTLV